MAAFEAAAECLKQVVAVVLSRTCPELADKRSAEDIYIISNHRQLDRAQLCFWTVWFHKFCATSLRVIIVTNLCSTAKETLK